MPAENENSMYDVDPTSKAERSVSDNIISFADLFFNEIDKDRTGKLTSDELIAASKSGKYSDEQNQTLKAMNDYYFQIGQLSIENLGVYPDGISKGDLKSLAKNPDAVPGVKLTMDLAKFRQLSSVAELLTKQLSEANKSGKSELNKEDLKSAMQLSDLPDAEKASLGLALKHFDTLAGFFNLDDKRVGKGINQHDLDCLIKALNPAAKVNPFVESVGTVDQFLNQLTFGLLGSNQQNYYDQKRRALSTLNPKQSA